MSKGFKSLRTQYQEMDANSEAGIGISADSAMQVGQIINIQDELFTSLLNHDARIIIQDSVYQFMPNNEVKVTNKSNINDDGSINWTSGITLTLLHSNLGNQSWASMNPNSRFYDKDNNNNDWPKSNNKKVRAVHTKWCTYYVFYASMGAKIRMERKGVFGWVNIKHTQAKFNRLSGHYRFMAHFGSYSYDYYELLNTSTSNQNVHQRTFGWQSSPVPYLFSGHYHFMVGTFISDMTITYGGKSKSDVWTH